MNMIHLVVRIRRIASLRWSSAVSTIRVEDGELGWRTEIPGLPAVHHHTHLFGLLQRCHKPRELPQRFGSQGIAASNPRDSWCVPHREALSASKDGAREALARKDLM